MNKLFVTFLLLSLIACNPKIQQYSNAKNELLGKYHSVNTNSKRLYEKELHIEKNGVFSYIIPGHINPVAGFEGRWIKKGDTIYISEKPPLPYGIIGVEKTFEPALEKSHKRALRLYWAGETDTTLFVGCFLKTAKGIQVQELDAPILIDDKIDQVKIELMGKSKEYLIDTTEKLNQYKFYIRFDYGRNYRELKSPPFTKLIVQNQELRVNNALVFRKIKGE
ncbi:hypothetical protein BKI52_00820 [marine bacterium AO1-C]|nr:hypothetical protein BKI52_00820 [marine bacterium AO1-C]